MIRRIEISGYKTFNNFSLDLQELNVIFGSNAAGKSNFLDSLQLLSSIVSSKKLKDAYEFPHRGKSIESFYLPERGIEGLLEKESVRCNFVLDVELSEKTRNLINKEILALRKGYINDDESKNYITEKFLRYTLEIEMIPKQGILRITDEKIQALKKDMNVKESRSPFLEKNEKNKLSLRMEGQSHPTYFDLGLDHSVLSKSLYMPHYPHITALIKELQSWRFFYFEPRERMRASIPTKEVKHIGMMGEELAAYLHGLKNNPDKRKKFESICKAVKLIIPSIDGIETSIDVKTGDIELFVIENGRQISSRLISEGTLRLLGLLSITGDEDYPSVICFEEPENGINPRKIKLVAEYLKNTAGENTQIIVTTHSTILPDEIPNENLFVCKKKNGFSSITPFTEIGLLRESAINVGLDEEPLPSEIIMRGDLDA